MSLACEETFAVVRNLAKSSKWKGESGPARDATAHRPLYQDCKITFCFNQWSLTVPQLPSHARIERAVVLSVWGAAKRGQSLWPASQAIRSRAKVDRVKSIVALPL
jgi:hypothetical protein